MQDEKWHILYFFVVLIGVLRKRISWPEGLLTEVAGDGNTFQVICFYVALYGPIDFLFSTHFTPI